MVGRSLERGKAPGLRATRRLWAVAALLIVATPGPVIAQGGGGGRQLSLEDLLDLTVSSASKYSQNATDAPASITILTAEEMEGYGFRNLAEALQMLTSFSIGTDHSYTYTGVRGFARPADYNNRVLVLVDGHTKNENTIGAGEIGDLRLLDIADIERVEVVRGPGSSLYGSRAMFAVVNIITKRGADIDGARLWTESGSFGKRAYGASFGRLFDNGLDLVVSGGWAEADGEDFFFPEFDSPDSHNGMARDLNWGEVARGRASLQHGNLRVWGAGYSRQRGVPTAPYQAIFADARSQVDDKRWMVDLQYQKEVSSGAELTIRSYADYFQTAHKYPHPGDNLMYLRMGATWAGTEGRLKWDIRSDHRLVLGGEFQWTPRAEIQLDDELGVARFQGDYPFSVGSLFLQDEFQITPELALTVGLRHDRFSSKGSATTPRFAVVYHPIETTTLKALWGTAFRPPSLYEANFETPYGLHLANSGLQNERIRSAELLLEQRLSETILARVGVFRNDVLRLIDQKSVPWPEGWPPSTAGSPIILQYQNGADVRAEGIELEVNGAWAPGTFGYARYAYQRVEDPSSGARAPNFPSHAVKVGGTRRFSGVGSVGANLIWESSRQTLAATATDPFALLDLAVTSEPILDHFVLSVSARNLFDTKVSLPSGPQHSLIAIPQPSRSLLFRLGVEW